MKKQIYLDNASTTPLDPRVLMAMNPFLIEHFGNPGSIHKEGVLAKNAVIKARNTIAGILGGHSDEIIFTSGGTEANNFAIMGVIERARAEGIEFKNMHIVTSAIEHSSVKDVCEHVQKFGVSVSYISVDEKGIVDTKELQNALRTETILVSVIYVNNEIGTIEPIHEISKIIRAFNKKQSTQILFHTDASQAPAYLDITVSKLGADLLTFDSQKIYGPKGIGMLYKKRGISLVPLFFGGGQEFGMRPGTENVPGIIGFAEALKLVTEERESEVERLTALRDYFIKHILKHVKGAELNGDTHKRVANNINVSFPGVESEWVVLQLDAAGIAAGSKSACLLNDEKESYVVSALGKSDAHARSSVRFTLGKSTTKNDVDYTIGILRQIIK
ncbi:MAG: cysteine desulfurase [Parcubacteria group bacterium]|nr:cysteine desulfurase [Parcubacteria group bacterium]